jgi:uncharacterized membrane protein
MERTTELLGDLRETMLHTRPGRIVTGAIAVLLGLTLVGLLALWPDGDVRRASSRPVGDIHAAQVKRLTTEGCEAVRVPGCRVAEIELESGPDAGDRTLMSFQGGELSPELEVGDTIRVVDTSYARQRRGRLELPGGGLAQDRYRFVDWERGSPLLLVMLVFVGVAVVVGRGRGLLSLVGLGLSLLLLVKFVVPAMLEGSSPLLVALVGAYAVMFVTMLVTHGPGLKTSAAVLGTAATLLLTTLLALAFVDLAHITGLTSDEAALLQVGSGGLVSAQGLVLAGMVIGALGVLDDVTVSQASTVIALRRADPTQSFRKLYRRALSVGRDHAGATVNTLVLAYAGASLPVLLVFSQRQTSLHDAVNLESVSEEIVATLVGSIGLLAAVPLTTALAALLVERLPPSRLGDEHAHPH